MHSIVRGKKAAIMQYMVVMSPSDMVVGNLGGICLRGLILTKWSTSFVVRH